MKVPFLDLQAQYFEIQPEVDIALKEFLSTGQFIGGEYLEIFETNYANFVDAEVCVGLANGLDAIEISLKALNIGAGDEVIVPSHTFIATWLAVSNCGATPVPVEPDMQTFSICSNKIESAITKKTKAIIPVHLYGQPVDLDPIIKLAHSYNLFVVEDAAQAHGALYKNKRIGSHGDVVAWSFYPGKNLGAFGDGGAITTNNNELAKKIRMIGNYGSKTKYVNELIGMNSRLDPMQACILDIKLKKLDEWNIRRRRIAEQYLMELKDCNLVLPDKFDLAGGSWHLFPVMSDHRDHLQQILEKNHIDTLVHYPIPPHKQTAYLSKFLVASFPVAEQASSKLLSLPIGPHLSMDQVNRVISVIKKHFN